MSAGRPPTTVEGEVRVLVRRLVRSPHAALLPVDRITTMNALVARIGTTAQHGRPDREALLRLAAHAQAWAELTGGESDGG